MCKDSDDVYVYDSFGRDYKIIIPKLKTSGNGRITNTDRDVEQGVWELDCGQRSLAFLCLCDGWNVDLARKL